MNHANAYQALASRIVQDLNIRTWLGGLAATRRAVFRCLRVIRNRTGKSPGQVAIASAGEASGCKSRPSYFWVEVNGVSGICADD